MNKKKIIIIIAVIATLLGIGFGMALFVNRASNNMTAPTGPTQEEKQQESAQNADTKKDIIEKPDEAREPTTTPDDSSKSIDLSAQQEDDGTITVFTKLYGYSDGTCEVTVKNADKSYTDSVTIIYQPEFSSCAGFSVPKQQLGNGTWLIILTVNSDNKATEKQISYEVK